MYVKTSDRLPVGRIAIKRQQRWPYVRVNDLILDCVGFIARRVASQTGDDIFDYEGTCFFVAVPSAVTTTRIYVHAVTAKHVLEGFGKNEIVILVNKRGGGVAPVTTHFSQWTTHPDNSVDVAVIPFISEGLDYKAFPVGGFVDRQKMEELKIGLGDEVFITGLFSLIQQGEKRNMPLLRYGNIAMFPTEPIQVGSGFADVYLIESRSIGGISGSPVYVRQTLSLPWPQQDQLLCGVGTNIFLLGLMHGHWDIKESEINEPRIIHDSQRGVNLGIAVVVPASKILEVINLPNLVDSRSASDQKLREAIIPTPDTNR